MIFNKLLNQEGSRICELQYGSFFDNRLIFLNKILIYYERYNIFGR